MKMSAGEVALYAFVLAAAISFAIAALIQGTFWVIRLARRDGAAGPEGGPGGAP